MVQKFRIHYYVPIILYYQQIFWQRCSNMHLIHSLHSKTHPNPYTHIQFRFHKQQYTLNNMCEHRYNQHNNSNTASYKEQTHSRSRGREPHEIYTLRCCDSNGGEAYYPCINSIFSTYTLTIFQTLQQRQTQRKTRSTVHVQRRFNVVYIVRNTFRLCFSSIRFAFLVNIYNSPVM